MMKCDLKAATSGSNNNIKLWDIREGKQVISMTSGRLANCIDF